MIDATRIELLGVIADLCEIFPDWRFGQLVCNLASRVDLSPDAAWNVQDQTLVEDASEFLSARMHDLDLRGPSFLRQRFEQEITADDWEATSHPRLNLLKSVGRCGQLYPRLPLGRLIARLVAIRVEPRDVTEWAAALWDFHDDELLSTIRLNLDHPTIDLDAEDGPWSSASATRDAAGHHR